MLKPLMVKSTLVAFVCSISFAAHAIADESKRIDVPAGELVAALEMLSRQAAVDLVFQPEQLKSFRTGGVTGTYSPPDAIRILLQGTPFQLHTDASSGAMVIAPPPSTQKSTAIDSISSTTQAPARSFWSRLRLAQAGVPSPSQGEGSGEVPASNSNSQKTIGLEEVVVTAQKREERLIDVPQAVAVLSADDLLEKGIVQFRDYADMVPGLSLRTNGAGDTKVSIRGVTMGSDVSPVVGIYVDDVPYGSSSSLSFAYSLAFDSTLFDLDRIEILKGPQGTYYGASAMGGLIKYVSKVPSTESFSGHMQTGVANTSDGGISYTGSATINAPILTNKLAVRATAFYSRDGGYIDNVARRTDDVNQSNVYGVRADMLFKPTERLTLRLAGFVQNIDRDGTGTADYSLSGAQPLGTLTQNRPTEEPFEQRFRLVSGTVIYDLDWASLTSITSYQSGRTQWGLDYTALYAPVARALLGGTYGGVNILSSGPTDKFVQEVRLASGEGRSLEWVTGGFYTRETTSLDQRALLFDLAGNLTSDNLVTISAPSRFEEYAGFGTLTWHLTDRLNLSGGIRYAHNSESVTQFGSGRLAASRPTAESSESVVTYLGNARYQFNDHANLYVRYATGYRPGGPNYRLFDATTGLPVGPASFDSDSLKSYEVGFKGETNDRRFGIDLSAFNIDWDNIILFASQGGVGFRDNAPGGARVLGSELTLTARPVDFLTVMGSLAYLDAKMREADVNLRAAKGERLPGVPRVSAALNADYELPVGSWQPTIGATLRHVSDRRASFGNSAYRLPDYTALDLRAGFTLDRLNGQIYVRNLFDERGQVSAGISGSTANVSILQPRTIGVSLTARF